MVAIPNMNWMGNEPTGSAFDVYRWYMGGGNPVANTGGGGGGGTGIMQAYQPTGGGGGIPGQGLNMVDFNAAITERQNRVNNPSKFAQWAYDNIPGINQPYTIEQLMKHGATQQFGGPGIIGFLGGKMDKYHTLPRADQAFISSMMGYSDPNTNMANKDPYGINVRSAFGNYADYTNKAVDKLGKTLTESAAKRGLTFDPVTGKVTGGTDEEIADWQKATKLLNEKFGFYTKGKKKIQNYRSDVNLIDKARQESIKQAQGRVDKSETDINKAAKQGKATGSVNPHSAYGKKQGYTGGNPNPHTDTGWSGSSKSSSSKSSGSSYSRGDYGGRGHHWAEGGMVDADLSKDPEYLGWKKVYKMNPELGSMHEKHPTFIKFYKKHERDQKKFGGLAGLLYG
tara:strand:+ start:1156 stop:2346 length:1191 start_codon:yes stop_codon:yes gene_type:complete